MTRSKMQELHRGASRWETRKIFKNKKTMGEDEMFNRFISIFLVFVVVLVGGIFFIASATAEESVYPTIGYLTNETALLSAEGVQFGEIFSNEPFAILGAEDSRLSIITKESWDMGTREPEGFIEPIGLQYGPRKSVEVTSDTTAWAIPNVLTMGTLGAGKVQWLGQIDDLYCIWTADMGVLFVKKDACSDIKADSDDVAFLQSVQHPEQQATEQPEEHVPSNMANVIYTCPVYNLIGGNIIGYLEPEKPIEVSVWGEEYTQIKMSYDGHVLLPWVETRYLQKLD